MKKLLFCAFALFITAYACAQDLIITSDAKKIEAKVLEISETEIKYKEADDLEGPTYVLGLQKILSIVFKSGKVKVFRNNQEDTAQPTTQVQQQEMHPIDTASNYLSTYIHHYIEGFPKNVVFVDGDFSMLYDDDIVVYFQFNYDNAEIVEYGYNDKEIEHRFGSIQEFRKVHPSDFEGFEISHFESLACDKFNSVARKKKCVMMPSSSKVSLNNLKQYILNFNVEKMDVCSDAMSAFTINNGTKTGGVILCGKITISDLSNQENVCTLYVDRVKGMGSPHFHARIVNTLEELFGKQLFAIKKVKL